MSAAESVACFTFDNLAEAEAIGAGRLAAPLSPGEEPSLALGLPRILALLERHGVRATFFLEGWNGEYHPEAVAEIVARGHELGMHGWLHERWSRLEPAQEAALARRATEALERAAGVRPRGFRAPGGSRSRASERILLELGYAYDASLGDGMQPGRLPGGLAQVPFVWSGVDGAHYLRPEPASAADVRDAWLATLERVASRGGLLLLVCHPFITGVDEERLAALDAVLAAARADPRVALRTAGEIAARLGPAESPQA